MATTRRRETPTQFQRVNQPLRTAVARASHLQSGLVPNRQTFSAGESCRNLRRCLHRCQFALARTRSGCIDRRELGRSPTRTLLSISGRFWAKCAASRRMCRGVSNDVSELIGFVTADCPTSASSRYRQLRSVNVTAEIVDGAKSGFTTVHSQIATRPCCQAASFVDGRRRNPLNDVWIVLDEL